MKSKVIKTAFVAVCLLVTSGDQPNRINVNALTSPESGESEVQESLHDFFNSITNNDERKTKPYRDILEQETIRQQQAFETRKGELRIVRQKSGLEEKYSYDPDGPIAKNKNERFPRSARTTRKTAMEEYETIKQQLEFVSEEKKSDFLLSNLNRMSKDHDAEIEAEMECRAPAPTELHSQIDSLKDDKEQFARLIRTHECNARLRRVISRFEVSNLLDREKIKEREDRTIKKINNDIGAIYNNIVDTVRGFKNLSTKLGGQVTEKEFGRTWSKMKYFPTETVPRYLSEQEAQLREALVELARKNNASEARTLWDKQCTSDKVGVKSLWENLPTEITTTSDYKRVFKYLTYDKIILNIGQNFWGAETEFARDYIEIDKIYREYVMRGIQFSEKYRTCKRVIYFSTDSFIRELRSNWIAHFGISQPMYEQVNAYCQGFSNCWDLVGKLHPTGLPLHDELMPTRKDYKRYIKYLREYGAYECDYVAETLLLE